MLVSMPGNELSPAAFGSEKDADSASGDLWHRAKYGRARPCFAVPCDGACLSWALGVGRSAFWPIAWRTMACFLPPAFLACVIRIASRLGRFFHPCRQQLQIEKIDSLNSRLGHRLHVTRMATEANVKNLSKDGTLRSRKASEYIAARCLSRK